MVSEQSNDKVYTFLYLMGHKKYYQVLELIMSS